MKLKSKQNKPLHIYYYMELSLSVEEFCKELDLICLNKLILVIFFYCSSDKVMQFSRSWSRIHLVPASASWVLELQIFTIMYNWSKRSFATKMPLNSAMLLQDAHYCSNVKDEPSSNNLYLIDYCITVFGYL